MAAVLNRHFERIRPAGLLVTELEPKPMWKKYSLLALLTIAVATSAGQDYPADRQRDNPLAALPHYDGPYDLRIGSRPTRTHREQGRPLAYAIAPFEEARHFEKTYYQLIASDGRTLDRLHEIKVEDPFFGDWWMAGEARSLKWDDLSASSSVAPIVGSEDGRAFQSVATPVEMPLTKAKDLLNSAGVVLHSEAFPTPTVTCFRGVEGPMALVLVQKRKDRSGINILVAVGNTKPECKLEVIFDYRAATTTFPPRSCSLHAVMDLDRDGEIDLLLIDLGDFGAEVLLVKHTGRWTQVSRYFPPC